MRGGTEEKASKSDLVHHLMNSGGSVATRHESQSALSVMDVKFRREIDMEEEAGGEEVGIPQQLGTLHPQQQCGAMVQACAAEAADPKGLATDVVQQNFAQLDFCGGQVTLSAFPL